MRILLAAVLLLRAVPVLALAVHPEVPISPAERAPSEYTRHQQIAGNGEIFVAAWTDYRSGPGGTYAARFREDGTLLDPVSIRVAPNSQAGAVIWSGNAFLVAYLQEGMVTVRALSPEGVLGEPIQLFGSYVLAESYRMRMATNGDSVLLVTSDATAALLGPDGYERRQISFPWVVADRGLGVAAAGSTYLVVAGADGGRIKTQVVTAEGDFGASHVLMDGVQPYGAEVASDGERFLVAWANGNLYAQFVGHDGTPVESPFKLTNREPSYFYTHSLTRLVRRGDEYLLVYRVWEGERFSSMRLGNDGVSRGPLLTGFVGDIVDVLALGGEGAVLGADDAYVLSVAFFDAGTPAELRNRTPIAISGKQQARVRLARVGDGIAAAWTAEQRDAGISLSRGPGSVPVRVVEGKARLIDVVVESGTVWVLWSGWYDDVFARRFTADLQAIDPDPVLILETDSWHLDFSVAAGGGVVALVQNTEWGPYGWEPEGAHVIAHILRGTTTGIDKTTAPIAGVIGVDRLPAIGWDGTAFLIAWANATDYYSTRRGIATDDVFTGYYPDDRILGARMTAAAQVLDGSPFEIARGKHVDALTIARDVVAWQTYESPDRSSRRHTYAARAEANAAVADLGGDDSWFGAFTADGDGFLLTRATAVDATTLVPEVLTIDRGLAITSAVALFPLTVDFIYQDRSGVSPFDADMLGGPARLLAYSRIAAGEYGHTRRIFVRRLSETNRRRSVR